MESESSVIPPDLCNEVKAIRESVQQLNAELMGVTPENSVEKTSLCEQTTVRHLLEKIEYKLEVIASSGSVEDAVAKSLRAALTSNCNRDLSRVSDIQGADVNEERRLLLEECQAAKTGLDIIDGTTFKGKSLEDVKAGISAVFLENAVVVIVNYMDVQLTAPAVSMTSGIAFNKAPATIAAQEREVLTYHSNVATAASCGGTISYLIEGTDLRLVVNFSCRNDRSFYVGLAFIPKGVQVDEGKVDALMKSVGSVQPQIRRDCQHSVASIYQEWSSVIKADGFRAIASMTPGPKAELRVEILQVDQDSSKGAAPNQDVALPEHLEPLLNDAKVVGKSVKGIRSSMGRRGCVIDITSLLNVPLEDAVQRIEMQEQHDFMPFGMNAFSRKAFFASSSDQVRGIFSYRIASTDLRLVVTFNALTQGNSFTIAFLPMNEASTVSSLTTLMTTLNKEEDRGLTIRTDKKLAYTRNGPQIISMRNLRVWANMTDEDQALLRIVVYTE